MSKTFRAWDVDQVWLLPPSVHDFVPAGHPAHLVRELVRRELDLSAIFEPYEREERGQPPYHPAMMVALLLYAYTQGVYASRRIARGCEERLDIMAVTGMQRPDFRTISDFRKRHLEALAALFVQVLWLCRQAGLVRLGHVALDGTRLKANASKHKAMSYGRMRSAEAALAAEVQGWLAQAEAADAAEDAEHGPEMRGDELPDWVADQQARLERIRAARAALEAEARADPPSPDAEPGPSSGMVDHGRPARAPDARLASSADLGGRREAARPPARAQRNFTDPDSRIMKTRDGFIQGYNGQLAVDSAHQIITAQRLTTNGNDQAGLVPLLEATTAALGRKPRELSADAGFCREDNLEALAARGIRGYLAPGRGRHGNPDPSGQRQIRPGSRMADMAARLKRAGRRSRYRLRKQTVEPVFGQIKHARGFRQFLLRGFAKVQAEWALVCIAHNLTKLVSTRAI
jgi:transposase